MFNENYCTLENYYGLKITRQAALRQIDELIDMYGTDDIEELGFLTDDYERVESLFAVAGRIH